MSALAAAGLIAVAFALLGLLVSALLGLSQGNTLLFMVLCASASYIAVPAAMRMTLLICVVAMTVFVAWLVHQRRLQVGLEQLARRLARQGDADF